MESANANNYEATVKQLISYGEAEVVSAEGWPDYPALGVGPEQIPDLIRIATDEGLNESEPMTAEAWAPVHAWRALGRLRAEESIEPLLSLFDFAAKTDNEWVMEEVPEVYGMIGPVAFPALAAYLADLSHDDTARVDAITSITNIANSWPEARQTGIELLMKQLERFAENGLEVNGYLILALVIDLDAVEAAPLIEQAYEADCVDPMVAGDWENAQVDLGLLSREAIEQRHAAEDQRYVAQDLGRRRIRRIVDPSSFVVVNSDKRFQPESSERHQPKASNKKAKNKMAKQSRKKNRKR